MASFQPCSFEICSVPDNELDKLQSFLAKIQSFTSGHERFSGLENWVEARVNEMLVGACRWRILLGNVGVVWPPVLDSIRLKNEIRTPHADVTMDQIAVALLKQAIAECDQNAPRLMQTLVPINMPQIQNWFEQVGFRQFAERVEMACDTRTHLADVVKSPLTYESIANENQSRFQRVFAQTFIDSLDQAPDSYSGDLEQVWATYRDAGVFRPEHWLIARHESRDVGCLIVTDDPRSGYCELTYLGLAPEFRGQGWGWLLTHQAQHLARAVGRDTLQVAVAAQNAPALKTYTRVGFVEVARRMVLVLKND